MLLNLLHIAGYWSQGHYDHNENKPAFHWGNLL
jgi:hypothetical protein